MQRYQGDIDHLHRIYNTQDVMNGKLISTTKKKS